MLKVGRYQPQKIQWCHLKPSHFSKMFGQLKLGAILSKALQKVLADRHIIIYTTWTPSPWTTLVDLVHGPLHGPCGPPLIFEDEFYQKSKQI